MSKRDYTGSDQQARDGKACDRIVNRTASRISGELDRMRADLPEMASPQSALEGVAKVLIEQQAGLMEFLMKEARAAVIRELRETVNKNIAEAEARSNLRRNKGG